MKHTTTKKSTGIVQKLEQLSETFCYFTDNDNYINIGACQEQGLILNPAEHMNFPTVIIQYTSCWPSCAVVWIGQSRRELAVHRRRAGIPISRALGPALLLFSRRVRPVSAIDRCRAPTPAGSRSQSSPPRASPRVGRRPAEGLGIWEGRRTSPGRQKATKRVWRTQTAVDQSSPSSSATQSQMRDHKVRYSLLVTMSDG